MTTSAQEQVRLYEKARADRGDYEANWRTCARYAMPEFDKFWQTEASSSKGEIKHNRIYDSTAVSLLPKHSAVMMSVLAPRNQRYQDITFNGRPGLMDDEAVRAWAEKLRNVLFKQRYRPGAGFQGALERCFDQQGVFGNGPMYCDWKSGEGFRYRSDFLGDFYIEENFQGLPNEFRLRADKTNINAQREWPSTIPSEVASKVEQEPHETQEYLHYCIPNPDFVEDSDNAMERRWLTGWVHIATGTELATASEHEPPYQFARYSQAVQEKYGRGPTIKVLPTIRELNEMFRQLLRAGNKSIDPPLLAPDDSVFGGGLQIDLRSGAVNYGGVNGDGRQMVMPLQTGANMPQYDALIEKLRDELRDAYLMNLFQVLRDTHTTSATEAMIRNQEKGDLLAPLGARQETELFTPLANREISLLLQNNVDGLMDEMPDVLDGEDITITYESPVARLQRAEELTGMNQLIAFAGQLAVFDETVSDAINVPDMLDTASKVLHAPVGSVKSREEYDAIQQKRAEDQQAQNVVDGLPQVAKASKDFAQAESTRRQ